MQNSKQKAKNPIDSAAEFLAAQRSIDDLRLHALLWFNAFEEQVRSILAWRLGCGDRALPGWMHSSQALDLALLGHECLRSKAQKFIEARNSIAHKFHETTYEKKLQEFCHEVLQESWPTEENRKLEILSGAVRRLAVEIACGVNETPPRGDFPFPQGLFELD